MDKTAEQMREKLIITIVTAIFTAGVTYGLSMSAVKSDVTALQVKQSHLVEKDATLQKIIEDNKAEVNERLKNITILLQEQVKQTSVIIQQNQEFITVLRLQNNQKQ